jgi:hypothetical protein
MTLTYLLFWMKENFIFKSPNIFFICLLSTEILCDSYIFMGNILSMFKVETKILDED